MATRKVALKKCVHVDDKDAIMLREVENVANGRNLMVVHKSKSERGRRGSVRNTSGE